jgi:cAMP phosphodiesterase
MAYLHLYCNFSWSRKSFEVRQSSATYHLTQEHVDEVRFDVIASS